MSKSIAAIIILLVGLTSVAVAFKNNYSTNNTVEFRDQPTAISKPSSQPTSNPIVAQPTAEPTGTPTATITFKPVVIRVISPINDTTYKTNEVELAYYIGAKVHWSYYLLDSSPFITNINNLFHNNGWVSFTGNTTLNLPEGPHKIVIAIQTEENRFTSYPIEYQTINFNVDTTINDSSSNDR